MADTNQPLLCSNIRCDNYFREFWNPNYIEGENTAPWDNYYCPLCGARTAPAWIREERAKLSEMVLRKFLRREYKSEGK